MPNILVTGGAGFIGSATVEHLKRAGHAVTILDNLETARADSVPGDIRFIEADIRDTEALRSACQGMDAIVHLAALVSVPLSVSHPEWFEAVNVTGTRQILSAASEAGVSKIVLASTAALYGPEAPLPVHEQLTPDPRTPYAAGKWQNEKDAAQFVKQGFGEAIALRFFNVYGPKQSADSPYAGVIAKAMMAARLGLPFTVFGDGEQTRDFIHVHDVARAISHALFTATCPYGIFNVATESSVSLNHILDVLQTVSGSPITVNREPARDGDIRHSAASVRAAVKQLDFQAAITLAEGLRQTWFSHPLARSEGGRSKKPHPQSPDRSGQKTHPGACVVQDINSGEQRPDVSR